MHMKNELEHLQDAEPAVPTEPAPQRRRRRVPLPPRPVIDFTIVEPHHAAIHGRLENWGIWSRGRYSPGSAPGFARYRSPSVVDRYGRVLAAPKSEPLDIGDARRIGAAVSLLPEPHRKALNWFYLQRSSPMQGCQDVGTTMWGLQLLIRDGRQMLVNRNF